MPILKIPTPLRVYTGSQTEVEITGNNVAEAMQDLINRYPTIESHLFNGEGSLRPFVNLYLGDENIKDLQGMDTQLEEGDRLLLIPSIAGGS